MSEHIYLPEERLCPSQRGLRKVIGEETRPILVQPSFIPSRHWDPVCLRKLRTSLEASEKYAEVKTQRHIQWTSLGGSTLHAGLELASTWLPSNFQKDPTRQGGTSCLPAKNPHSPHQKEPCPKGPFLGVEKIPE